MDETANNSAETPELAQSDAPEAQESTEQPETSDQSYESDDGEQYDAEEDLEEVDLEGDKLAVPKSKAEKLRAAMLRQADYTRKTQELAQQREQSQAEIAEQRARIEADRANFQSAARLVALDEQLQQYANVNWDQAYDSDPVGAGKAKARFDQLLMQRHGLVAQIQQHEAQRALQEREATARAMQQANEVLGREIKGWSPEVAKELRAVAKSLGADDKSVDSIREPWVVKALYAQKVLSEMTAKAQAKPPPPPATVVKTVTGGAQRAAVDPDKMTPEQFAKWRNADLRKRGKL